jgi:hypothetical protein
MVPIKVQRLIEDALAHRSRIALPSLVASGGWCAPSYDMFKPMTDEERAAYEAREALRKKQTVFIQLGSWMVDETYDDGVAMLEMPPAEARKLAKKLIKRAEKAERYL